MSLFFAEAEDHKDFSILHNQKVQTNDGECQVDIMAKVVAVSVSFKAIIVCVNYTIPI